ncbi:ester cyclase [Microbispora sp. H10836]|uniref:ester cyclase n=1 Tax=Microbispora sp. H10836 TaxID=2729106 RepID=UPI00147673AD|nr:ester cyclase [Microbispora sp. H10836]
MYDVVDRTLDAWNAHDLDALSRCYGPDAVVVGPEMEAEGREEIGSFILQIWEGFPDLHFTLWETIFAGDAVALELMSTGTHTGPYLVAGGDVLAPTGRSISVRASWFWHLEDHLILSHRFYYDQLQIYSQLGLRFPLRFGDEGAGSGASGERG